jgi:hypothetical protein
MPLSDEMALVAKLISLELPCREVWNGVTTQAERRERLRPLVKKVSEVTYTVIEGKRITMAQAFIRAYGVDL